MSGPEFSLKVVFIVKNFIKESIIRAVLSSKNERISPLADIPFVVESPKNRSQGDFSTNIALVGGKQLKISPKELADELIPILNSLKLFDSVRFAGPGFLNFKLTSDVLFSTIDKIYTQGSDYGSNQEGLNKKVHIEFVSANPTGPLHIGHGRGAAVGSALARIYKFCGYEVLQEYYVNDAGRQMDILALSVFHRYQEKYVGETFPLSNAYEGDYVGDIAEAIKLQGLLDEFGGKTFEAQEFEGSDSEKLLDFLISQLKSFLGPQLFNRLRDFSSEFVLSGIQETLAGFKVSFDSWFSEKSLVTDGSVENVLKILDREKQTYTEQGALWFRASNFGDEKDRVLVREGGAHTYFATDLSYHVRKAEDGYFKMINVWGADHHGYIPRLRAALEILKISGSRLEIMLVQFASLVNKGRKISMSTRKGSFVTLDSLISDVGADAARFFYLMRKADQHMEFDVGLAKEKSSKNPVYYVQYAFARISSVLAQAKGLGWSDDGNPGNLQQALSTEYEQEQILLLSQFPDIVMAASDRGEPNIVTQYLKDLAYLFHSNYASNKILVDNLQTRNARLCLASVTGKVFENGLNLLNISSPKKM